MRSHLWLVEPVASGRRPSGAAPRMAQVAQSGADMAREGSCNRVNSELLKRLGECQQLPTLPGVVFQLLELCRQEEASLQEAGDLIGSDPALAARVLQVVNSPF